MRIKTDNGNVTVSNEVSVKNPDNRRWTNSISTGSNTTDYSEVTNFNTILDSRRTSKTLENYTETQTVSNSDAPILSTELVCNRQYRINSRNINTALLCDNTDTNNLEDLKGPDRVSDQNYLGIYILLFTLPFSLKLVPCLPCVKPRKKSSKC